MEKDKTHTDSNGKTKTKQQQRKITLELKRRCKYLMHTLLQSTSIELAKETPFAEGWLLSVCNVVVDLLRCSSFFFLLSSSLSRSHSLGLQFSCIPWNWFFVAIFYCFCIWCILCVCERECVFSIFFSLKSYFLSSGFDIALLKHRRWFNFSSFFTFCYFILFFSAWTLFEYTHSLFCLSLFSQRKAYGVHVPHTFYVILHFFGRFTWKQRSSVRQTKMKNNNGHRAHIHTPNILKQKLAIKFFERIHAAIAALIVLDFSRCKIQRYSVCVCADAKRPVILCIFARCKNPTCQNQKILLFACMCVCVCVLFLCVFRFPASCFNVLCRWRSCSDFIFILFSLFSFLFTSFLVVFLFSLTVLGQSFHYHVVAELVFTSFLSSTWCMCVSVCVHVVFVADFSGSQKIEQWQP